MAKAPASALLLPGSLALCMAIPLLGACRAPAPPAHAPRVDLVPKSNGAFELVPRPGQHPHCLVFSLSKAGVLRQLTMPADNRSLRCEPSKPIGGVAYRVPPSEGPVRLVVLFSSEPLMAPSIAQQLLDLRGREVFTAMDLRAPGQVALSLHDFVPPAASPPTARSSSDGAVGG